MEPRATIDFETRSACSLKNCGSWRYSLDPTTQILCLCWRLPHWEKGRTALWHPAFPHLGLSERFDWWDIGELVQWIEQGGLVEAHNAWFERGIWNNILRPKYDFPPIGPFQWRCSAAKAASHALPRNLEEAGDAMEFEDADTKDTEGHKLMMRLCKPRKPRKADRAHYAELKQPIPILYHESKEEFERVFAYCRQDVLAEEALSNSLPDLNEAETEIYLLDQLLNERGFGICTTSLNSALALLEDETQRLNMELGYVTNGYVLSATERDNLKDWLWHHEGVHIDNTQKDYIDDVLNGKWAKLTPDARKALEILRSAGRSSTAKFVKMAQWLCPDNRVHGGLLYHGASTGRWSGQGVQPQNFVKGDVKIADMERAWEIINTRDRKLIETTDFTFGKGKYPSTGSLMAVLSAATRGAIIASPGNQLYVADYAGIEARVLPWLADDQETIKMFETGADLYLVMAEEIFGYPCTKDGNPKERALGKVAVLGLGYQMGWSKFISTVAVMARMEIEEDLARRTVDAYRARFWRTKELWSAMEEAAIEAVETGEPQPCGKLTWAMTEGDEGYQFLYCTLPSGRRLAYPDPEIKAKRMPWGDVRPCLTYMGINSYTRQWQRQDSYGGLLVENADQAVSRDLMAAAIVRCDKSDLYTPILSVHDELIAEAPLGMGDVTEFEHLMAKCPDWATNCPVAAEGWRGVRYRK